MTIIKSYSGRTELYIGGSDGEGRWVRIETVDHEAGAADRFPRAELLAALGVDKLGCGCDEADANQPTAVARAEAAEKELAEVRNIYDKFGRRAEAAEAKLEKVRAIKNRLAPAEFRTLRRELHEALADHKPPFTLPTEAGAGIVATHVGGDDYELRLYSNSEWIDTTGTAWAAEQVMNPIVWTNHRLIGPES